MNKSKQLWVDSLVNFLKENQRTAGWVAARSGVTRSQIGRIISGRSEPTLETMNRISNALNIEASDWFTPREAEALVAVDLQAGRLPLSPAATSGDLTASDCAAVLLQLQSVPLDRRLVVLAILFDDSSIAPESLDGVDQLLSTIG